MTLGKRIKQLREAQELTMEELGAACNTTKQTIYKYETGIVTNIPLDRLEQIAAALDTNPAALLGYAAPEAEAEAEAELCPVVPIYNALNEPGRAEYLRYGRYLTGLADYRQEDSAPQVEYIRHYLTAAAAGYAAPIEGEDYELIPRSEAPARADFSIDITGDSMEPYIKDGQRVYVQRGADLQEFEVGIFFVDGDVYCKQWCRAYDGSLYLLSANPAREDANLTLHRDSARSCVCFGKVLLKTKLPKPTYV